MVTRKAIIRPIPGMKIGKLTCLSYSHTTKHVKYFMWECECGKQKIINGSSVVSGHAGTCGCSRKAYDKRRILPESGAAINQVIYSYKRHACDRGHDWSLSRKEFIELNQTNCFYCDSPPSHLRKNKTGDYIYNGIDRVNNNLGYSKENCVSCCYQCNQAKSSLTQDEFLNWIEKIHAHQQKIKINYT